VNCSDKDPIDNPKRTGLGFDQAAEVIIDRTETAITGAVGSGFIWLFGNLFKNKKDHIIFTIVII
jgi:hypothetical protein